jgi:hypothetical protein
MSKQDDKVELKVSSKKKKYITISSSSWTHINVTAICNHENEIKSSKRIWSKKENCHVKNIDLTLTSKSADNLYRLLRHLNDDCDEDTCSLCKKFKKEYW